MSRFILLRRSLPYLALGSGVLALSLSSIFVRRAAAPGLVTSFYRMALAALVLLPFFLRARARNCARSICARSHARGLAGCPALNTTTYLLPLLAGVFTALDHAIWSTAIQLTTVANATLLNNLAPLWVALFATVVWKQQLTGRFWLGLLLACSGAFVVLGHTWLHAPALGRGDLLGAASSLFYGGYYLVGQRARQDVDTLTYVWLVALTSALLLLAANLAFRNPLTGYPPATYAAFAGAALISQVAGYFSVGYALGHLPASTVAPTMIAQPVLTALLAIPLAGEPLQLGQILGGLGVLSGILMVIRSQEGW